MGHKLIQGDKLPRLSLNLVDGESIVVPDYMPGRYFILLFYRGNW